MRPVKKTRLILIFAVVTIVSIAVVLFMNRFVISDTPATCDNDTVTLFAAAGTTAAMQQIAIAYEQKTGRKVIMNFASSSTLAKQIAAGADFDIYISANSKWMDFVEEKKLINVNSRVDLLSDRLVLVTPSDSRIDLINRTIKQVLSNTAGPVAMGDPAHVPVGIYTKEALKRLDCWANIKERMVPAHSVRAAQQYVETGQCRLGIIYNAGASQSQKVNILGLFGEALHTPIRFSAAMALDSISGMGLMEFFRTPSAQHIFINMGFSTLTCQVLYPSEENADISLSYKFDMNEWQALFISIKVAATCVLVVAVPGILLGYILGSKSFPGRSLLNAFVYSPLVIPPVVTGYLALTFLGRNSFLGEFLYRTLGISFAFNWIGAVFIASVMGFPLLVRSVKTSVEMTDYRYRHAANTLGSGPVRTFFTITLPLAGPGIFAGLVLAFARSLGEFGATAVFVGNIPGKTQTLPLAIYNFMQIPGAESSAMRLVLISIAISFAAIFGSEILLRKANAFKRTY